LVSVPYALPPPLFTLPLRDALPISASQLAAPKLRPRAAQTLGLTLMGLGAALLLSSNLPSIGPHAVTALLVIARFELSSSAAPRDRKSTRLNSSHVSISYAVFCLKK